MLVALVRMVVEAFKLTVLTVVKLAVVAFKVVPLNKVSPRMEALRLMALPEAVVLVPLARAMIGVVVATIKPLALVVKKELVTPVTVKLVVVAVVNREVEELAKPELHSFQLPPWQPVCSSP